MQDECTDGSRGLAMAIVANYREHTTNCINDAVSATLRTRSEGQDGNVDYIVGSVGT